MAYVYVVAKAVANRTAGLTEIYNALASMGWTLHDNQDGSGYRVYKSAGENNDRITEYIRIQTSTANQIRVEPYYTWDAVTHTGQGQNTSVSSVNTSETGFTIWVYGNKNLVFIQTKVSTTYYFMGFGHLNKRFWTTQTKLTGNAVQGANAVLNVESTSGFKVGANYQILGANNEGRDTIQVNAILSATSLQIANLPRGYSTGSIIGQAPSTFGGYNGTSWLPTCPNNAVGLNNTATILSLMDLFTTTAIDPDVRGEDQHVLMPFMFRETDSIFAYHTEFLYNSPVSTTVEDTFDVGRQDSGTSTGSNTSTTLRDTGKNWTVNAFVDKVVIITAGTGAGQIRKISSNTATELTISAAWTTTPDGTSQYVIADEGYRLLTQSKAAREGT